MFLNYENNNRSSLNNFAFNSGDGRQSKRCLIKIILELFREIIIKKIPQMILISYT